MNRKFYLVIEIHDNEMNDGKTQINLNDCPQTCSGIYTNLERAQRFQNDIDIINCNSTKIVYDEVTEKDLNDLSNTLWWGSDCLQELYLEAERFGINFTLNTQILKKMENLATTFDEQQKTSKVKKDRDYKRDKELADSIKAKYKTYVDEDGELFISCEDEKKMKERYDKMNDFDFIK